MRMIYKGNVNESIRWKRFNFSSIFLSLWFLARPFSKTHFFPKKKVFFTFSFGKFYKMARATTKRKFSPSWKLFDIFFSVINFWDVIMRFLAPDECRYGKSFLLPHATNSVRQIIANRRCLVLRDQISKIIFSIFSHITQRHTGRCS
jgi:hypothetical protein